MARKSYSQKFRKAAVERVLAQPSRADESGAIRTALLRRLRKIVARLWSKSCGATVAA